MRLNQLFLWGSERCVWFEAGVWVSAVLITHSECIIALISQTCYVVTRSELQRIVNNFQNNSTGFIYSCQHKYSPAGTLDLLLRRGFKCHFHVGPDIMEPLLMLMLGGSLVRPESWMLEQDISIQSWRPLKWFISMTKSWFSRVQSFLRL